MRNSAVLLIDCPDRKGLVARVAGLLYERGANILHADQHQDHELGLFFMRVEWGLGGSAVGEALGGVDSTAFDLEEFKAAFTPMAEELGMRWHLTSGGAAAGGIILFAVFTLYGGSFAPVADGGTGLRDTGDRVKSSGRGEAGGVLWDSI